MHEKWATGNIRRMFAAFSIVCLLLVVVQYRFNYFSLANCGRNDRFVKRVVERVYYELKPTKRVRNTVTVKSSALLVEDQNIKTKLSHSEKTCKPMDYVLFLKTHKTGSSTITNILNRYADKHNMTVLLPMEPGYYSFDWPNKFRLSSAMHIFKKPNFLANHARYSRKSMNFLFPRNQTNYISVLRHPVSQWESTFQYMSFPIILDIADKEDPLEFFLNNPPSVSNIRQIARMYPSLYLIRNPLFYDLGLDYEHFENATFIRRAINTLSKDFNLILIMEHFDESLTLLRRRLCWDIDDVVYFKMNERLNQHKRRVLTQSQTQKIKNWNNADMVLYNFFVERFWKEVKNEGPGFYEEVLELKKRRNYYASLCIEKEAIEEAYSSVYVKGYKMRTNLSGDIKTFCERMLKNELRYLDYFRSQHAKWVNSMEGISIENFEQSADEADIFIEDSNIKSSSYVYSQQLISKKKRRKHDKLHFVENENKRPKIEYSRSNNMTNGLTFKKVRSRSSNRKKQPKKYIPDTNKSKHDTLDGDNLIKDALDLVG